MFTLEFLTNLLAATVRLSTPITLAAIGATICERSGIVNIAMEGIMVVGAFFAAIVAYTTGSPWLGLLAGVLFGGVYSLLHAFATVTLHLDHVVSGAVMNVLAFGITRFLMVLIVGHPGTTPSIPRGLGRYRLSIPLLSDLPLIGRALFGQTPIVYMGFFLVAFLTWFLFKTKTGLHIRAAGEHPLALETIGVSVYKMRYLGVFISGLASGLAGAYLSIEANVSFTEGMSAGRGFIALAAMISGGWHPLGAFLASLFFGFADALQMRFQVLRVVNLPGELFIIFPYLVTVIAVAGLVRRSRPPRAVGKDFMIERSED
ncbi:inner-membrane translocator [Alkalispirochaeta sphaeroplastigenens]|uniref:Inner-membrane translocator n=1 Tax=Alkalispirochaeta sphaeroplastigenens TaxID=1187066 RepID=A0A2S4JGM3_9SPIO|nr:ABC transporter permease [Alkalispirochaeta sphaeroplastigenens]POQ98663.1 inner-membrane translocator [Alkalispirochaeta sphaeroplastigenens]